METKEAIKIGTLIFEEKDAKWIMFDINNLLKQLSSNPRKITFEDLVRIQKKGIVTCFAVKPPKPDGLIKIIGMGSIYFIEIHTRKKAVIEDVVVDKKHRRKGLAEEIITKLVAKAKEAGVNHIDLTSEPDRVGANKMYQKMGFEKRKTNCYRLIL